MRITRTLALAATAAAALAVGTVIPAAGATPIDDSDVPSYQEFAASTYRDLDGAYIVNGDELISGQSDLRSFVRFQGRVSGRVPAVPPHAGRRRRRLGWPG